MSYVLTASSVFSSTLEKIVAGLNRAGFSRNDFRTPDLIEAEAKLASQPTVPSGQKQEGIAPFPLFDLIGSSDNHSENTAVFSGEKPDQEENFLEATLKAVHEAHAELVASKADPSISHVPVEVRGAMDLYPVRPEFIEEIRQLRLPQFYREAPAGLIFADADGGVLLDKSQLLDHEFHLADCDVNDFVVAPTAGDLVKLDLLKVGGSHGDYEPTRVRLKDNEVRKWKDYLSSLDPEAKRRQLTGLVGNWLGKMPPLAESDLQAYIRKILGRLSAGQLDEVVEQQHAYVESLRQRVRNEMLVFSRRRFKQWIDLQKIDTRASFALPIEISPRQKTPVGAENSLYVREEKGNGLEERMSEFLSDCENVRWWHRNQSGRGFYLNGPINHFPDFVLRLQSGLIILLETKGGDRDNSDSDAKIELGQIWEKCAGRGYRYLMVFETSPPSGAYSWASACELLRNL